MNRLHCVTIRLELPLVIGGFYTHWGPDFVSIAATEDLSEVMSCYGFGGYSGREPLLIDIYLLVFQQMATVSPAVTLGL